MLNLEGNLYRSQMDENDILIDFDKIDTDGLRVVYAKIDNSSILEDLAINQKLVGHKVLFLYFFDEINRNLISFEIPAIDLGLSVVNGSFYTLDEKITDAWYHKIMEGIITKEEEIINTEQNSDFSLMSVNNEATQNVSANITYKDPYARGFDEQHSKVGRLANIGSTVLKDFSGMYATFQVISQSILRIYGPGQYENIGGESAVWFGSYSNPVKIKLLYSGNTYRDFVKQSMWSGTFDKKTGFNFEISLGYSFGPVSVTGPKAGTGQITLTEDKLKTVYPGGSKYTYEATGNFANTRLYNINDYYTLNANIGVAQSTTGSSSKNVTATVTVPVYGNGGGSVFYETRTGSAKIFYNN